jgi:hypothetical protein
MEEETVLEETESYCDTCGFDTPIDPPALLHNRLVCFNCGMDKAK